MQMLTKKVQASITTIKERTGLYKIEKNKYFQWLMHSKELSSSTWIMETENHKKTK